MRDFHRIKPALRRAAALTMSAALLLGNVPALAVDDGVKPTYDEAYYAMTDYYGNLTEGSVVKSYTTNGAGSITDYGEYDEVINLTDGLTPTTAAGKAVFQFAENAIPAHFYFEGKTAKPFENLPWTLAVHYTLNGVATKAEDLAGKTGVVEITVDAIPNESASEYSRYNYTLEAMAIFNQDDILSLEAPGAQVQLIGNLRAVLFLGLPGEECHFTIRVGSDDFSFSGMTILMVPATLSQLSEISKLSERKDELEDDYDKISTSLDTMLNALDGLSGSLYATAGGVEQLTKAQGTYLDGKGKVREDVTALRGDLSNLADVLDPVESQIASLSQTISESKALLNSMADTSSDLRAELVDLEEALEDLEDGSGDVKSVLRAAGNLQSSLNSLSKALGGSSINFGVDENAGTELKLKMSQVKQLHEAYTKAMAAAKANKLPDFFTIMLTLQGKSDDVIEATLDALEEKVITPYNSEDEQRKAAAIKSIYAELSKNTAYADAAKVVGLYIKMQGNMSFQAFCQAVLPMSKEYAGKTEKEIAKLAEQANNLWLVYAAGEPATASEEESVQTDPAPTGRNGTLLATAFVSSVQNDGGDGADDNGESGGSGPTVTAETVASDSTSSDPNTKTNDAVVDLITDGLNEASSKINSMQKSLNETMSSLASPTRSVVSRLATLCGELEDLTGMVDDAEDASAAVRGASSELRAILKDAESLQEVLDDYEPTLQETLKTVNALSTNAAATIRTTQALVADTQDLMIAAGDDLDEGTKKTLEGLSASLRAAAKSLSTTPDMKAAKKSISSIIEDTWNEYTGDINNILMMDADAEPVSLTDERNDAPQSIQVLIRTQEIKQDDGETEDIESEQAAQTTFWGRVAQMFKDFWAAITGIFKGKD